MSHPLKLWILVGTLLTSSLSYGVTWEEQAERLQNVSATLLDGVPMAEPPRGAWQLSLKSAVSILPTVNNKVGAKDEKAPAAPVHSVPQLGAAGRLFESGSTAVYVQAWAGILLPGAERLIGVDAELSQSVFGGAAAVRFAGWGYLVVGVQQSDAELSGEIASQDEKDEFTAETQLTFLGLGYVDDLLWGNLSLGTKQTTSKFTIKEDSTSLEFTDELDDSSGLYYQGAIGYWLMPALNIGIAQLLVPKRLTMTRMFVSYDLF